MCGGSSYPTWRSMTMSSTPPWPAGCLEPLATLAGVDCYALLTASSGPSTVLCTGPLGPDHRTRVHVPVTRRPLANRRRTNGGSCLRPAHWLNSDVLWGALDRFGGVGFTGVQGRRVPADACGHPRVLVSGATLGSDSSWLTKQGQLSAAGKTKLECLLSRAPSLLTDVDLIVSLHNEGDSHWVFPLTS